MNSRRLYCSMVMPLLLFWVSDLFKFHLSSGFSVCANYCLRDCHSVKLSSCTGKSTEAYDGFVDLQISVWWLSVFFYIRSWNKYKRKYNKLTKRREIEQLTSIIRHCGTFSSCWSLWLLLIHFYFYITSWKIIQCEHNINKNDKVMLRQKAAFIRPDRTKQKQ